MTAKELHDKIMSSSYEDGLKAIQQYADEQSRETAIQFKIDTSPLTPSIVDGEKKVREATEKLYDNWKSKQQNNG